MKTRTKEVTTTVYTYIADDGTEFGNERECKYHEFTAELRTRDGSVWVVYDQRRYRESVEVFSSEANAEKSLSNVDNSNRKDYKIEEVFIDMRFLSMNFHSADREGFLDG